jgi:NAD(P)-dependent dehydrogenase (short-subunit alcohol dehydrogenase family)
VELEGKRALVTGGAQGLGEAIARLFAERGAKVAIADVNLEAAERVADDIGDGAIAIACDVTDPDRVHATIARAAEELGGLNTIVNNAGIEIGKPIPETSDEEFKRLMDINVTGVFYGIKYAIPALVASGGGSIINMSSVAGLAGVPLLGAYCASKAAVLRLTQTAAIELRDAGIRVNAICPSFIKTEMVDRLVAPFEAATGANFDDLAAQAQGRLGTCEEVAETAAFLASDDASFITGTHYVLDNALTASVL